jgi:hypothetical protein
MMIFEWFTAVFSDPTEQARLFTVAISTILAVSLLLVNQWFISNRARNSRLIEKLEDLTSAIHEFYSLGIEVNRSLLLDKKYNEDSIDKFTGVGIKIDTLCSLYFSHALIDTNITANIISIGMDELNEPKLPNGATIPSNHPYIEGNEELHNWFEDSQSKVKLLIKKHIS